MKHIESVGNRRWRVSVPMGRDAAGKQEYHHKSIRGNKPDAQRYVDWITGLVAA
jgi:hypothetical protein